MPRSFKAGLLVMLLSACGESNPEIRAHDEQAARELRSAAAATLGSESFVVETKVTGSPLLAQELTRTYVAPDRLRLVSSVAGETILIGETAYVPRPHRPGHYEAHATGERSTVEEFFPHLADLLQARQVVSEGDSFSFTLPVGWGRAEVADGRIVSLTVHEPAEGEQITAAYTFRMFDEAPPVEAPPKSRVIRREPLPPCDEATPIEVEGDPVGVICDPAA